MTQADHWNNPPEEVLDINADMTVGEILTRTREYYDLTLRDVELALRIRASQLSALETGNYDQLPGRVYAIGFVRAYAEYLGLDANRMVQLYKIQAGGGSKRPTFHIPAPASQSKLPNITILAVSVISVVALIMAVSYFKTDISKTVIPAAESGENAPIENAVWKTPLEDTVENTLLSAAGSESVTQLLKPQGRIVIQVKAEAWVEITNAKKEIILSRILKPGDSYLVPDEAGIKLDTGNIGGLEFIVDGQTLPALGNANEVKRDIKVTPETLANYAQQKQGR